MVYGGYLSLVYGDGGGFDSLYDYFHGGDWLYDVW